MHMVHLNKNIFHNISVVDVQHSVKSLFFRFHKKMGGEVGVDK